MGPGDMYGDRYNSKVVVLLLSGLSIFINNMWAVVEWIVLNSIFGVITKGDIDGKVAVWFMGGFVFCCELLGGMESVAMTDAVQAGVMLLT
jgi:Na+/proline symporter